MTGKTRNFYLKIAAGGGGDIFNFNPSMNVFSLFFFFFPFSRDKCSTSHPAYVISHLLLFYIYTIS